MISAGNSSIIIYSKKTNKHSVLKARAFKRVLQRFGVSGGTTGMKAAPVFAARSPENIAKVEAFFEEDCRRSILEAVKRVHKLSPSNREARVTFSQRVLRKEAGWENCVILWDEKLSFLAKGLKH